MQQEFAENRLGNSYSSSTNSDSASQESADNDDFDALYDDAEEDIINNFDNIDIEGYDLSKAFSRKFYSEYTISLWNFTSIVG